MSKINLTVSADSAEELAALIGSLSAQFVGTVVDMASVETQPARPAATRGRKPKAAETPEAPTAPEAPVPTPAEVVAARVASVSAEAAPEPAQEAEPLTRAMVQQALVAVVQKHGRDVCGAICKAHGGPNLTALPETSYSSVYAMAQDVLAMDKDAAVAKFRVAA